MGTVKYENTCAVICGGDMISAQRLKSAADCGLIICADSGYDRALSAGVTPHLLVGDFDSVKAPIDSENTVKLPTQKDFTDTHAALDEGLKHGYKDFMIFCATGNRMDHTFANVALLKMLMDSSATGKIILETGYITLLKNGSLTLPKVSGYVSIFAFGGDAKGVTLEGFEYPLNDFYMKVGDSIGISNHIVSVHGTVTVKDGILLIFYDMT